MAPTLMDVAVTPGAPELVDPEVVAAVDEEDEEEPVLVVVDDELFDEHAASTAAVTTSTPSTTHLPRCSPMTTLSLAELLTRIRRGLTLDGRRQGTGDSCRACFYGTDLTDVNRS